jgi:hypothetical protein
MKLALVTDAWQPQVNGVVTTLVELVRELRAAGHEVHVIHPGQFKTRPCPGYAGIDLAVRPAPAGAPCWMPCSPMPCTSPPKARWAGRRAATASSAAGASPRRFTPSFPKSCTPRCGAAGLGLCAVQALSPPLSGRDGAHAGVCCACWQRGFKQPARLDARRGHRPVRFSRKPAVSGRWGALARPVALFVGACRMRRTSMPSWQLDFPGTKVVCGVGPVEARCASATRGALAGLVAARRTGQGVRGGRCVRVSQPLRNLWPGHAGSHGHRHARGGLPGGRAAGGAGPTRTQGGAAACRPATGLLCQRWPCHAMRPGPGACSFQLGAATAVFTATWCRHHNTCHTSAEHCHKSVIPLSS